MTRGLLLLALLLPTTAAAATKLECGKKPPKGATVEDIRMTGPRPDEKSAPVYYTYANPTNLRLYFRPADLLLTIDEMIKEAGESVIKRDTSDLSALSAAITKDLPLADHTDIRKYPLHDTTFDLTLDYVVTEVL